MEKKHYKKKVKQTSIKRQINKLIAMIIVPFMLIISVLLVMMININEQYTKVLQNANIAADFNMQFKDDMDLEMWYHVIKPRAEDSISDLPMEELDRAVEVLHRLEETTTQRDNAWRIRSMLNMCENLRKYMLEIAETKLYDDRMELLDRNIRGETGLTLQIETYMHDYTDDEVRELARLQSVISNNVLAISFISIFGVVIFVIAMLLYTLRFTRRITKPIDALAAKARRLGQGDFSVIRPISAVSSEIKTLDNGFNDMVGRINTLMERQIEDQKYLHRAELELLQAQINPHFLYNTLDSIVVLAESGRNSDVVEMVTSLSVFFRNSLSKGKQIIPLRSERDHVTSYLEIQKVRYSDILSYEINIPEDLLSIPVPKLVLQPLVENAIYHGTKNKRGVGKVTITGEDIGDKIQIKVVDDGAGMTDEQLNALRKGVYEDRHTGLGLVNVHKRIKLYCGDEYGLAFESKLGEGTTVTMILPKNTVQ